MDSLHIKQYWCLIVGIIEVIRLTIEAIFPSPMRRCDGLFVGMHLFLESSIVGLLQVAMSIASAVSIRAWVFTRRVCSHLMLRRKAGF